MSNPQLRQQRLPWRSAPDRESDGRVEPVQPAAVVYQESAMVKELKQRAANVLSDHSLLLLNAITMNETPTKARLRSYRHLTGQPQPPHEYAPAKRKHKEAEAVAGGSLSSSTTTTIRPVATSRSSGSSGLSSSTTGARSSSNMDTTTAGTSSSRPRRESIPLDDEFSPTHFQGPLNH